MKNEETKDYRIDGIIVFIVNNLGFKIFYRFFFQNIHRKK